MCGKVFFCISTDSRNTLIHVYNQDHPPLIGDQLELNSRFETLLVFNKEERKKNKKTKDFQKKKTEQKQTSPPAGFCYVVTLFSLLVSSVQLRHTGSNTDLYLLKQVDLNQDIKQVLFMYTRVVLSVSASFPSLSLQGGNAARRPDSLIPL